MHCEKLNKYCTSLYINFFQHAFVFTAFCIRHDFCHCKLHQIKLYITNARVKFPLSHDGNLHATNINSREAYNEIRTSGFIPLLKFTVEIYSSPSEPTMFLMYGLVRNG